MQPNEPQPSDQSIDYLNSIAAPERVNTVNPLLLWGAIGGILLLVIGIFFALMTAGGTSKTTLLSMTQRTQALRSLATEQQENIKSSDLRTYNSSLTAILADISRSSTAALGEDGARELEATQEGSVIASEYAELASELDDARLNNIFDRVYAREIGYQIGLLKSEMDVIKKSGVSSELRTTLEKNVDNLEPLQKEFTSFSDTQN